MSNASNPSGAVDQLPLVAHFPNALRLFSVPLSALGRARIPHGTQCVGAAGFGLCGGVRTEVV